MLTEASSYDWEMDEGKLIEADCRQILPTVINIITSFHLGLEEIASLKCLGDDLLDVNILIVIHITEAR